MRYLDWFKAQSKRYQMILIACCVLLLGLSIFVSVWFATPHYSVLFNHLDNRDSSKIIGQLEQNNIHYQLHHQGEEILIDQKLVDKTRLKLTSTGLQFAGSVGFELFDKNDFGMTDFSQKINYQRALQGELERTIASLDEVKQARVHLVLPENRLFQHTENQPRAAVTLYLNRPLSSQQVKSIQQLIAASVAHLAVNKIIIVDQEGHCLTHREDEITSVQLNHKKNLERYLNEKVTQMLQRIFSKNEAMVKIDVTLNYDELRRELVKPQHEGYVTHEKETQHSIVNNLEKNQTEQNSTREKTYQLGKEQEHFLRANGQVERLTVSVVVPQGTQQETLLKIEQLVKSIVGFNAKRGDCITVEALIPTYHASRLPNIPHSQQAPIAWDTPLILVLAFGLVCILLITCLNHLKKRNRIRNGLLTELTEWLGAHE